MTKSISSHLAATCPKLADAPLVFGRKLAEYQPRGEAENWRFEVVDPTSASVESAIGGRVVTLSLQTHRDCDFFLQPASGTELHAFQQMLRTTRNQALSSAAWPRRLRVTVFVVVLGSHLYGKVFGAPVPLIGSRLTALKWGAMAGVMTHRQVTPFPGTQDRPVLPNYVIPFLGCLYAIWNRRGPLSLSGLVGVASFALFARTIEWLQSEPKRLTRELFLVHGQHEKYCEKIKQLANGLTDEFDRLLFTKEGYPSNDWKTLFRLAEGLTNQDMASRRGIAFPTELFDSLVIPVCQRILNAKKVVKDRYKPKINEEKLRQAHTAYSHLSKEDLTWRSLIQVAGGYKELGEGEGDRVRMHMSHEAQKLLSRTNGARSNPIGLKDLRKFEIRIWLLEASIQQLTEQLQPADPTHGIRERKQLQLQQAELKSLQTALRIYLETKDVMIEKRADLSLDAVIGGGSALERTAPAIVEERGALVAQLTRLSKEWETGGAALLDSSQPNKTALETLVQALKPTKAKESLLDLTPTIEALQQLRGSDSVNLDSFYSCQDTFNATVKPIREAFERFAGAFEQAQAVQARLKANRESVNWDEPLNALTELRDALIGVAAVRGEKAFDKELEQLGSVLSAQQTIARELHGAEEQFRNHCMSEWVDPDLFRMAVVIGHYRDSTDYQKLCCGTKNPKEFTSQVLKHEGIGRLEDRYFPVEDPTARSNRRRETFYGMLEPGVNWHSLAILDHYRYLYGADSVSTPPSSPESQKGKEKKGAAT